MNDFQGLNQDLASKLKALLAAEPPPPADLKQEVFTSLDALGLLGDFAELFAAKFGATHASLLDEDQTESSN